MKFFAILLIATASAINLRDPAASEAARVETLKASRAAVATQTKFAADHFATHTTAMNKAEKDCQDQKNQVRSARHTQITEGNQYPAFKTYGAK